MKKNRKQKKKDIEKLIKRRLNRYKGYIKGWEEDNGVNFERLF